MVVYDYKMYAREILVVGFVLVMFSLSLNLLSFSQLEVIFQFHFHRSVFALLIILC